MIHFFNEATLDIDKNMTRIDKEKEIFDSGGGGEGKPLECYIIRFI